MRRRKPQVAAVVAAAALLVAQVARGEAPDAGGLPEAVPLHARSVEVLEGQPAPFSGNLCDRICAAEILEKRRVAETRANLEALRADTEAAARARAESERDGRASWGVVLGVAGGSLLAGLVVGLVLGLRAQ